MDDEKREAVTRVTHVRREPPRTRETTVESDKQVLNKMVCDEMRTMLRHRKLKTSGVKAELVERLADARKGETIRFEL